MQPRHPKRLVMMPSKDSPMGVSAELTIAAGMSDREAARALIKRRTIAALERTSGNLTRASRLLEIHRNTLMRRLQDFELKKLPGELRRQNSLQMALDFRAGRAAEAPSAPKKPAGKPVRSEKRSQRSGRRGKLLA